MRTLIAVVAAMAVSGCATLVGINPPYEVVAPFTDRAATFDCAASRVAERGYVPEVMNRETGTVRAVNQADNFTTTIIVQMVGQEMRVTTTLTNEYGHGQVQHLGSTEYTRADVDAIASCAT